MPEQTYYEESPRGSVVVTWIFTKLLLSIVFIFFFVFARIAGTFSLGGFFSKILIGLVILIILVLIYLIFLWKTHHYRISDKGIHFKGGIIVRKKRFIPFYKITDVETSQNIIEQILGINKLNIFTAGTAQGRAEIVFEGIKDPEKPKVIVRQFMEKVQRSAGRASRYSD